MALPYHDPVDDRRALAVGDGIERGPLGRRHDEGMPGSFPAEVWLTSLSDGTVLRRVSGNEALYRLDPEVFLGCTQAWVFYYGHSPNSSTFELRRAEAACLEIAADTDAGSSCSVTGDDSIRRWRPVAALH